ncbi:hypothetical protein HMPREF0578_1414 [Mobiluncus mulieris 28-1]|nr:hypothetical protein HMPREF0578_1414 [Mobiluncus mulieris 28-1]
MGLIEARTSEGFKPGHFKMQVSESSLDSASSGGIQRCSPEPEPAPHEPNT